MVTLSSLQFTSLLRAVCRDMKAAKSELCRLDSEAGDGDLGVSMELGFRAFEETLETVPAGEMAQQVLRGAMAFNREAPSTLGTLIALGLMSAAKALRGAHDVDWRTFVAFWAAFRDSIREKGGASVGDRTILDSLDPFVNALVAEPEAPDLELAVQALERAVEAADRGAEATKVLTPKFGRASWLSERAKGNVDPGAAAFVVMAGAVLRFFRAGAAELQHAEP